MKLIHKINNKNGNRGNKKLKYMPILTHMQNSNNKKKTINLIKPVSYLNNLKTLHYWKTSDIEKPEMAENISEFNI